MANHWLRLWHDMPNDPKWRTIARAAKQPIPCVIAVYMHLLVAASTAKERGTVEGIVSEDVASALDLEAGDVDAILEAMKGRVLDGDKVTGWKNRQPEREDNSAERGKKHRERKRTQANAQDKDKDADKDQEKKKTALVERAFSFFCKKIGRNPTQYTLTDERKSKAMLRVEERLKINAGDLPTVQEEVKQAIQNLAASDYHRTHGYLDWTEQIFRSEEEFQKRLTWQKPKPEAANGTAHTLGNRKADDASNAVTRAMARIAGGAAGGTGAGAGTDGPGSRGSDGRGETGRLLEGVG